MQLKRGNLHFLIEEKLSGPAIVCQLQKFHHIDSSLTRFTLRQERMRHAHPLRHLSLGQADCLP